MKRHCVIKELKSVCISGAVLEAKVKPIKKSQSEPKIDPKYQTLEKLAGEI